MDKLVDLIANTGFPIAVSIYLLARIEVKLDRLSISIEKLSDALEK